MISKIDPLLAFQDYTVDIISNNSRILDIPSFEIREGDALGVRGKSGSGKTTLLNGMLGLLNQSTFKVSGQVIACVQERCSMLELLSEEDRIAFNHRLFAFIPQEPSVAFNPIMKVGKQLLHVRATKATKQQRKEKLKEILDNLVIEDPERIVNSYPHQLSGGQLQRCFIAGALLREAPILLADEPVSSLDAITSDEIIQLFNWVRQHTTKSLIIVSHDGKFLKAVTDQMFELKDGKLIKSIVLDSNKPAINKSPVIKGVPSAAPILSIDHLTATYQGSSWRKRKSLEALSAVSFNLFKGDRLGMVGTSGSGKSTLAKVLVGIHQDIQGTILLKGKPLLHNPTRTRARSIQLVHQDPYSTFNPRITVGDAIREVLAIYQPEDIEKTFHQLLNSVEIDPKFGNRYPHQFSGGQRQRLAIARALAVHPEILICDEIVSNLDDQTQDLILKLLLDLHRIYQISLIFISHNLKAVQQVAERIIVLQNGKIVEAGSSAAICSNPQHPYTKKLLAASL